jgi:hypothetical protein
VELVDSLSSTVELVELSWTVELVGGVAALRALISIEVETVPIIKLAWNSIRVVADWNVTSTDSVPLVSALTTCQPALGVADSSESRSLTVSTTTVPATPTWKARLVADGAGTVVTTGVVAGVVAGVLAVVPGTELLVGVDAVVAVVAAVELGCAVVAVVAEVAVVADVAVVAVVDDVAVLAVGESSPAECDATKRLGVSAASWAMAAAEPAASTPTAEAARMNRVFLEREIMGITVRIALPSPSPTRSKKRPRSRDAVSAAVVRPSSGSGGRAARRRTRSVAGPAQR